MKLIDISNYKVMFSGKQYSILNVIPYYISVILKYMEKDGKSEYKNPTLNLNKDDII